MSRRGSSRHGSFKADRDELSADTPVVGYGDLQAQSFRPTMSRRMPDEEEEAAAASYDSHWLVVTLAKEREMSAREAIAAQEAAESAIVTVTEEEEEYDDALEVGDRGSKISLMDLLEETYREIGVEGARYVVGTVLEDRSGR
ncbi:hypothetical protein LINPERHAP2_LOCUS40207 [Linum perenne]